MKLFDASGAGEARKWVRSLADPRGRDQAARELLRLGAGAAPALVEALRDREGPAARQAADLLAKLGPAATGSLLAGLRDDDPRLRADCARLLAHTGDTRAVRALVGALGDRYPGVRASACQALGEIEEAGALPDLVRALGDPEAEVRSAAALAVGAFGHPETYDRLADLLLEDVALEVRQAAAAALSQAKQPEALPYLMVALRDSFWWFEREQAVDPLLEAIERFGPQAVEALIGALGEAEGTVRRMAAAMLGRIGDPRAVEPLGMLLYDMHHEVGQAAAAALAGFGEAGSAILLEALGHPEAWLRQHALYGLALSGEARHFPPLAAMLGDPEREVVASAVRALAALGDGRALAVLGPIAAERGDRELSALAREAMEALRRAAA